MGMLVLNKRVEKLEHDALSKSDGGVVLGVLVFFDSPIVIQTAKINKEDGSQSVTRTYMTVFDNQARTDARRLCYSQFQITTSDGKTVLRNKQYIAIPGTGNTSKFAEIRDTIQSDESKLRSVGMDLAPLGNNKYTLGVSNAKWKEIFANNGTINTSDERLKDNITEPNEALMRAWGKVRFVVFQFRDALAEKGTAARLHVGVIAQEVQAAFAAEGLDATRYGLLCYDEWPDQYEMQEDGTQVLAQEAGSCYGIRYEEALALEAAYQRRRADKMEERMDALERRLWALEATKEDD